MKRSDPEAIVHNASVETSSGILVINSNSSRVATKTIASKAAEMGFGRGRATVVGCSRGPRGIDTALDLAISGVETVRVLARRQNGYAAVVIACGLDPGLDAARAITDLPVIGIGEAGMIAAGWSGSRFAIVAGQQEEVPLVLDMVHRYGFASRLGCVIPLELSTRQLVEATAVGGDSESLVSAIAAQTKAMDAAMADVIVLPGSVMGGLEDRVQAATGRPAISGLRAALHFAALAIDIGLHTSHAYKYFGHMPRQPRRLSGYHDLQGFYAARETADPSDPGR